jgi:hypothetical protein
MKDINRTVKEMIEIEKALEAKKSIYLYEDQYTRLPYEAKCEMDSDDAMWQDEN